MIGHTAKAGISPKPSITKLSQSKVIRLRLVKNKAVAQNTALRDFRLEIKIKRPTAEPKVTGHMLYGAKPKVASRPRRMLHEKIPFLDKQKEINRPPSSSTLKNNKMRFIFYSSRLSESS